MDKFKIGQLAKQANVNIETIRYYERRGLLPEPKRRESGYREYSHDDVIRLRFIKRAQVLGFTLKEISDLLSLRVSTESACGAIKEQAEAKIKSIEERIESLGRVKTALARLVAECKDDEPGSECPILEYLNEQGNLL